MYIYEYEYIYTNISRLYYSIYSIRAVQNVASVRQNILCQSIFEHAHSLDDCTAGGKNRYGWTIYVHSIDKYVEYMSIGHQNIFTAIVFLDENFKRGFDQSVHIHISGFSTFFQVDVSSTSTNIHVKLYTYRDNTIFFEIQSHVTYMYNEYM